MSEPEFEIYHAKSIFADVDPEVWGRIVRTGRQLLDEQESLIDPEAVAELNRRMDEAFINGTK